MEMSVQDIKNVQSEAGIVASVAMRPELVFYSDTLRPNHFTNEQNAYLYYAISELAKKGVEKVDAYNIYNFLNARPATRKAAENMTIQAINDFLDVAPTIARESPADYRELVNNVMECAFRRNTYNKLSECQRMCFNAQEKDISQKIYAELDNVVMEFSTTSEVPQYKDVVDGYWEELKKRQGEGAFAGYKFPFPTLNSYVTMERGELIIFGAEAKQGKSMMLLNVAASLLKDNVKVMYLDSELNSRLFTCRMLAHLTGIEFARIRSGQYSQEESKRIDDAIAWLKTRNFVHLYMPVFDEQAIYTTVRKVYHTMGIDALIVDYFKGGDDKDAFASYQSLGGLTDLVKNHLAGDLNIAAIGAAQATSTGKLADSAKIARNASTIIMIQDKTPEEREQDGETCGNKKMIVRFNRNGAQMADGEYIDLRFDGNHIKYEEAHQHVNLLPY